MSYSEATSSDYELRFCISWLLEFSSRSIFRSIKQLPAFSSGVEPDLQPSHGCPVRHTPKMAVAEAGLEPACPKKTPGSEPCWSATRPRWTHIANTLQTPSIKGDEGTGLHSDVVNTLVSHGQHFPQNFPKAHRVARNDATPRIPRVWSSSGSA